MKKLALALIGIFVISACGDDDDSGSGDLIPTTPKAYIGIEGTSPNGISSLAEYNTTNQSIENNVFRKANINPMGSQLSDIMYDADQNQFVLLVPGSNKIIYIDANSLVIKRQIKDLMQVRKVAKVSDFLYYVSSPELGGIYVINAIKGNIRSEIEIDGITNPTEIKVWEDMAFICNTGSPITRDSTVTIMRTTEDTIISHLMVGHSPNSMVIDEENQLWIMCSGEFNATSPLTSGVGSLWTYNLDSLKMAVDSGLAIMPDTVRYFQDNQLRPGHLTYDESGKNLYYITGAPTGSISSFNKAQRRVSETPLISGNFYGLNFDDRNLELYGMRTPMDIEEDGFLEVFDPVGNVKVSIRIGVKPVDVVFKQ
ncbi:MAG: hypothetical protein NXI09_08055 [Bacteroidetes bacterium]|nr:hypothetical protein [Bacteroidota bacterium]